MKILYVTSFFKPYEIGGAEISTRLYSKLLSREKKVVVLTPNYKNFSGRTNLENRNLVICRFAFPLRPKRIMAFFDTCVFQLYLFLQTFIAIKRFRPDLIHIQSSSMILGPFFASRLLGKKCVMTIRDHGYEFTIKNLRNELRKFPGIKGILKPWIVVIVFLNLNLRKFCIKRMNRIVTVSNYMKYCLTERLGMKYDKIRVCYMLKPQWIKSKTGKKEKKYSLLFLGRLDRAKGIELLLESFKLLKQKNIELLIAGNSNVEYYRNFVKNLNIKNVVFLGKIPHKDTNSVYEKADAITVPSLRGEPLSRVLIEAGYLGKPVIATDRGGNSEVIIDKKTGILVRDVKPSGFARGLEYVIKNPSKAKEMGKNLKRLANKLFDPEKNLKIISKIYRELL